MGPTGLSSQTLTLLCHNFSMVILEWLSSSHCTVAGFFTGLVHAGSILFHQEPVSPRVLWLCIHSTGWSHAGRNSTFSQPDTPCFICRWNSCSLGSFLPSPRPDAVLSHPRVKNCLPPGELKRRNDWIMALVSQRTSQRDMGGVRSAPSEQPYSSSRELSMLPYLHTARTASHHPMAAPRYVSRNRSAPRLPSVARRLGAAVQSSIFSRRLPKITTISPSPKLPK